MHSYCKQPSPYFASDTKRIFLENGIKRKTYTFSSIWEREEWLLISYLH